MSMFKHKKKVPAIVRVDIDFEPKISRLFIFRCLWIPVIAIPFIVFAIWFGILSFVHFFYMLILGKRSRDIYDHQMAFIRYMAGWQGYLKYFTNGHPKVLPWENA